ncbi:MAG: NAD(P)/FAD-dependent oxidoreductase [Desulfatiglandaceae bacterium]
MADFDLIVVGGGPGGVAAAIRGTQLGARTAICETDKWGGLCLNHACIPTKFFTTTGDRLNDGPTALDEPQLWAQKNELTAYFSLGTKSLLGNKGAEIFEAMGRLDGPGRVAIGKRVLESQAVIVAGGGEWVRPNIPGGDLPEVINSSEFLAQETLPEHTLFMGGGAWQLELAQFLVAAGRESIVVESARHILPGEDAEISRRLRAVINQAPLQILNQCDVVSLSKTSGRLKVDLSMRGQKEERMVDRVVYMERQPALGGLGLDTVGLTDLTVDDRQSTSISGLFAVGEVTGRCGWSHLATAQGLVAAENALGGDARVNPRTVPRVAFTRPQIGAVGLTEAEAEEADYDVVTGEAIMGVSPMAMIQGQSNGIVKIVAESRYGEVLGIHILAPMATELIAAGVLAVQMEATLDELARSAMTHPTISESLADAAREALGRPVFQPD